MHQDDPRWTAIDAALRSDRMMEALRSYRECTGAELAEALRAIEARKTTLAAAAAAAADSQLPAMVQAYLDSGHARRGDLVGHWRNRAGEFCVLVLYQREPVPMFELGVFPPEVGNWGHQLNGCSVSRGELDAALAGQRPLYGAEFADDSTTVAALRQRLAILFPAARAPVAAAGAVHWRASRTRLFALAAAPFERGFLLRPATLAAAEWSALLARAAEDGALAEQLHELPVAARALVAGEPNVAPVAHPLLWIDCVSRCQARAWTTDSCDTLFADLAAQPLGDFADSPTLASAAALLYASVDVGALRRRQLPWWLQGTAAASDCAVGLLAPHELRALAGDLADLIAAARSAGSWPLTPTDTTELQDFLAAAAAEGCWLVGIEPGT